MSLAAVAWLTFSCATTPLPPPPPPPPPPTAPLAERQAHDAQFGVRELEQRRFQPLQLRLNDGRLLNDATTLRGQVEDDSPTARALDADAAQGLLWIGLATGVAAVQLLLVGGTLVAEMTQPSPNAFRWMAAGLAAEWVVVAIVSAAQPLRLHPPDFLRRQRDGAMVHAKEDMRARLRLDDGVVAPFSLSSLTPECNVAWAPHATALSSSGSLPALQIRVEETRPAVSDGTALPEVRSPARTTFSVRIGDTHGVRDQRQFEAASCEEVADATALYLAGVIDAEAARPQVPQPKPLHVRGIARLGQPTTTCAYLSDGRAICDPDEVLALVPAGSQAAKHAEGARFWRGVEFVSAAGMGIGALGIAAALGSTLQQEPLADILLTGGVAAAVVGLVSSGAFLWATFQPDMREALLGLQTELNTPRPPQQPNTEQE